jgi:hypothetical protein
MVKVDRSGQKRKIIGEFCSVAYPLIVRFHGRVKIEHG